MTQTSIPTGYWQDAAGHLIPESKVKDIDKLRHQVVVDLCQKAEQQQAGLASFKASAMEEVGALVATSLEQYGVKTGGANRTGCRELLTQVCPQSTWRATLQQRAIVWRARIS